MSITTWWSSLRMHWRPMWVSSRHIPSWASATRSGSKDAAFSTAAAQKWTASYAPAAMLASTPNRFLNLALNACMLLSGLYAEKWLSWTKPSIGSAMEGRSCCSRKQSIRSEEHTSELQSHSDLVCRLLLEKKKKMKKKK